MLMDKHVLHALQRTCNAIAGNCKALMDINLGTLKKHLNSILKIIEMNNYYEGVKQCSNYKSYAGIIQ